MLIGRKAYLIVVMVRQGSGELPIIRRPIARDDQRGRHGRAQDTGTSAQVRDEFGN